MTQLRETFENHLDYLMNVKRISLTAIAKNADIPRHRLSNLKNLPHRNVKIEDIRAIERAFPDLLKKVEKSDIIEVYQMKMKKLEIENEFLRKKLKDFGFDVDELLNDFGCSFDEI